MQPDGRAALDALARFYDLRHGSGGADAAFYASLAEESPGPVLEVGCGTGRLLLPLAQAGRPVIGIDVSAAMLRRARSRIAGSDAAARVGLVQADVHHMPLRGAGLAIMALNTLCHLAGLGEQEAALAGVHSALATGGMLAVDVPNPHLDLGSRPNGVVTLEAVHEGIDGTTFEWSVSDCDIADQTMNVRLIWDTCDRVGALRRQSRCYSLRLLYRFELELLLRAAGFREVQVLGDFDGGEYRADSPRMIALARA